MTIIFAHRGSAGTCPENTVAAFKEAIRVSADGIELDVHLTKDNELVVIHDYTVDRTTNGKGRVKDYNLKEIQKLDAGSWYSDNFKNERISTLKEIFTLMEDNQLLINIELKNVLIDYEGMEELVIEEIKNKDFMDRVIISSYNHHSLKKIHELNPEIDCAILYTDKLYEPWNYASLLGAKSLHPPFKHIDRALIDNAKNRNVPIRAYTVNHEKDMQKLIEDKCSAIITDYPERAINLRKTILT